MSLVTEAEAEAPLLDQVVDSRPCVATSLPPEILVLIFQLLVDYSLWYRHPLRWTPITHVCRYWRNVALHQPNLWTVLSATDASSLPGRWIDEFIRRSSPLPLALHYGGHIADRQLREVALKLTHRLGALRIDSNDNGFLAQLNQPAPLLSKLQVFLNKGPRNQRIPGNFLGDDTPRLQDVTLASVVMPRGAKWLSTLRRLHLGGDWGLYDPDSGTTITVTVQSFLDLLSFLPLLEDLTVKLPFTSNTRHTQSKISAGVHLPHLTSLDVGMSQVGFANIFRYISVELPLKLNIWACVRLRDSMLIQLICEFFSKNSSPPVSIVWYPHFISFGMGATATQRQYGLTLEHVPVHMEDLPGFVLPIFIPSCNIRVLHIRFPHPSWLDLHTLDTVEELHIYNRIKIVHQLLYDCRSDSPFPSLRWIYLLDLKLAMDLDDLKEWVLQRESVTKLEGLCFLGCSGVAAADVQPLTHIIEVRFD